MATSGIPVAELFARLNVDASQVASEIRQFKTQLGEAATEAEKHAKAIALAYDRLKSAGASAGEAFAATQSRMGQHLLGIREMFSSPTELEGLSRSIKALGGNDIEVRFRQLNEHFKNVTTAFDAGQISARTYNNALQSLGSSANQLSDYLNNTSRSSTVAESSISNVGRISQLTNNELRHMGQELTYIGFRLTALVTGPLVGFAVGSLKLAGDMELAEKSMSRMTGSGDLALQTIGQLRDLAIRTPLEFKGALEGSRRLIALGFNAQKAVPILKTLGDATFAVGGDTGTLNRFIKALGDIQAKGHLAGEEIKQLANIPVPAVAIIAQELGQSTGAILEGTKKKAIDANTAINALMSGLQKRFGGEMEAQAETLNVLWKNVRERALFALTDIGQAFLPLGKNISQFANSTIGVLGDLATSFANLPLPLQYTGLALGGVAAAAGPVTLIFGQLIGIVANYRLAMSLGGISTAGLTALLIPLAKAAGIAAAAFAGWKLLDLAQATSVFLRESSKVGNTVKVEYDTASKAVRGLKDEIDKLQGTAPQVTGPSALMGFAADPLAHIGRFANRLRDFRGSLKSYKELNDEFIAEGKRTQLAGTSTVSDPRRGGLFGGITNETKQAIDDLASARLRTKETAEKEAQDAQQKAQQARQRAFGVLGIDDQKTKLQELVQAWREYRGTLTAIQRDDTILGYFNALSAGVDSGVINIRSFRQLLNSFAGTDQSKLIADQGWEAHLKLSQDITKSYLESSGIVQLYGSHLQNLIKDSFQTADAIMRSKLAIDEFNSSLSVSRLLGNTQGEKNRELAGQLAGMARFDTKGSFELLGIRKATATLTDYENALKRIQAAHDRGEVTAYDLRRAMVSYYERVLELTGRLTPEQEKHYQTLRKQVNVVGRLQQAWRGFSRQISTIATDFGRGIIDILFPRESEKSIGVSEKFVSSLRGAFTQLSSVGFASPARALEEIIQRIKSAGTVAEANSIALRHFGQEGPEIARALREGTLSASDLAKAIGEAGKTIDQLDKDSSTKVGKLSALFGEVRNAILRAFVEEGAKAIADFTGKHLKALINSLDGIIQKIPIIGKGLAGLFGNMAGGAGGAAGSILTEAPEWASNVDWVTGGVRGASSAAGAASSAGSGASSAASTAASGIMGTVGAVGAVGSMISGIVGNFQMRGMNKSLDIIVSHTLGTVNQLVHIQHKLNEHLPIINALHDRSVEFGDLIKFNVIEAINNIGSVQGAGGGTFNIYLDSRLLSNANGAVEVKTAASNLVNAIKKMTT